MPRARTNRMVTTTVLTCTVDTDVIVILVGKFLRRIKGKNWDNMAGPNWKVS